MLQWNRMYLLFVTLAFLLDLGPEIRFLNAQNTSVTTEQTLISQVTETSPGENYVTTNEKTMMMKNTDPGLEELSSKESPTTLAEYVNTTSEVTSQELQTGPESTVPPAFTTVTNEEHTTQPEQEDLSVTDSVSPGPSQTLIPSSIIETNATVSTPVSDGDTLLTTTPSPTTTPVIFTTTTTTNPITTTHTPTTTPTPTIISTTALFNPINNTTQEHTIPISAITTSTNVLYSSNSIGSSKDTEKDSKKLSWLIIAVIALVAFCILTTICVAVVIKRRKQSGRQNFGHANGQRSKKKKDTADDVWAGPVELGGGDCESPEEGEAQGEEMNGVEETGLSTFSKTEENGGVGRPGSPEVEKWEEKEPLLFIDEEKGTGAGKKAGDDAKEGEKKTDVKEAEPNGGETFCLTTAV